MVVQTQVRSGEGAGAACGAPPMRTPRSLEIDITGRCNLRCAYCYHFASVADVGQDLPTETWLAFFAELKRHAVLDVTLSGGEPFCREDLPALIDGIVAANLRFSVLSNGTLITPQMARLLAATRRCDYVQVSVDGSHAATHDSACGRGSFSRALDGLRALQAAGVTVAVRVTIHRGNVGDLDAIARFLLVELGLPAFSTNSAGDVGLCRENAPDMLLTTDERSLAMETLLRLSREYAGRIGATAGPLAEARGWTAMLSAADDAGGAGEARRGGRLNGCGVGGSKLAVRADGVITPCSQLPQIELGHIARDDLGQVWREHPELVRLRGRHTIPLSEFPFCADCAYRASCTGNCPGMASAHGGDAYAPSPDACLRRFLEDGGRLPGGVRA